CHTLSPDEGNKAGPTLSGVFGRRIATLPGYNFSPALKKLDIVWTPETVSKLFEVGPEHYTPGTKMPEQTIGSAEDRKALVEFLAKETINNKKYLAFALLLPFTQIILGRADRWALRRAKRIKLLVRHHNHTAVLTHSDNVESLPRVFVYPVLAFEFCDDALDRALHAEWLAATDTLG